jgi:hypothetical protein
VAPEPSDEPANGPYPEPGESTPPPPTSMSLRSILIPSSHPCLCLSSGLFPFWLSHQNPVHVCPLSLVKSCHIHFLKTDEPRPLNEFVAKAAKNLCSRELHFIKETERKILLLIWMPFMGTLSYLFSTVGS